MGRDRNLIIACVLVTAFILVALLAYDVRALS